MLTQHERLALLRAAPPLDRLPDERLERLAASSHEVHLAPGERLTNEGLPGRQSFVVIDGSASVTAGGHAVAHLGPGSFVGDVSGPIGPQRVATITAETPMILLVIAPRAIEGGE